MTNRPLGRNTCDIHILQEQSCLVDLRATPTGKHLSQPSAICGMKNSGLVLASETLARPSGETVPEGKLQTHGDLQLFPGSQLSCDLNKIPMMTPQLQRLRVKIDIPTSDAQHMIKQLKAAAKQSPPNPFSRRFLLLARPAKPNRNRKKLSTSPADD